VSEQAVNHRRAGARASKPGYPGARIARSRTLCTRLRHGGAEVKSYASVGESILLAFVGSAYGARAGRSGRLRLVTIATPFFR
jgi:hypothetical protein